MKKNYKYSHGLGYNLKNMLENNHWHLIKTTEDEYFIRSYKINDNTKNHKLVTLPNGTILNANMCNGIAYNTRLKK